MSTRSLLRAACLGGMLLVLAAGCPQGEEKLTPVKGKVTYKGAPLTGGTIVFIPDTSRGTKGQLALADIQPDGTFALKTNDTLGAVAGWHRVTVAFVQTAAVGQPPQSFLPARYRDPQQSGLTCEVKANKTNTIDFELD